MYQTLTERDFIEAFIRMGRAITDDNPSGNFTIDALRALYEWYENLEDDMGQPFELDVVGICCDWSEYDSVEEAAQEYDNDEDVNELLHRLENAQEDDVEDWRDQLVEWFHENTQIIEFDGGVLILKF